MACVYKITNKLNGKFYIGVTKNLAARKRGHFYAVRNGLKGRLYNSMRKYGIENFDFDVLEEIDDYKSALQAEREKILELSPPYNMTKGGEGVLGLRMSPETLAILSKRKKGCVGYWRGKKRPMETREKIRQAKLANPQRYWLGKRRTPETIAKISSSKIGKKRTNQTEKELFARKRNIASAAFSLRKAVICLNDNNVFNSAREASDFYGFSKTTVAAVASNKRKQASGLRFKYLEK